MHAQFRALTRSIFIMSNENSSENSQAQDSLVQYIAIRSDLKWPKGALVAQVTDILFF